MHKTCIRSSQTISQHGEERWIPSPTLSWGYLQLVALGEGGGAVFFKSVAPHRSTMMQWKATDPRIYGQQHKHNLMGLNLKKLKKGIKMRQSWVGWGSRVELGGCGGGGMIPKSIVGNLQAAKEDEETSRVYMIVSFCSSKNLSCCIYK